MTATAAVTVTVRSVCVCACMVPWYDERHQSTDQSVRDEWMTSQSHVTVLWDVSRQRQIQSNCEITCTPVYHSLRWCDISTTNSNHAMHVPAHQSADMLPPCTQPSTHTALVSHSPGERGHWLRGHVILTVYLPGHQLCLSCLFATNC